MQLWQIVVSTLSNNGTPVWIFRQCGRHREAQRAGWYQGRVRKQELEIEQGALHWIIRIPLSMPEFTRGTHSYDVEPIRQFLKRLRRPTGPLIQHEGVDIVVEPEAEVHGAEKKHKDSHSHPKQAARCLVRNAMSMPDTHTHGKGSEMNPVGYALQKQRCQLSFGERKGHVYEGRAKERGVARQSRGLGKIVYTLGDFMLTGGHTVGQVFRYPCNRDMLAAC